MSSGSSSRYQSRLFNFVHQQSRRLTEQWDHTFRNLQVATKWSVELLLYPVYLLFHSSESAGKTLHTKEPQSRLKLQPNDTDLSPETSPIVDTPIQRVLVAVQHLSSEETTATSSTTSPAFTPLVFIEAVWSKVIHYRSTTNIGHSQSLTISDNAAKSLNAIQPNDALKCHLPAMRGIASNLLNRNLVLVTADNEILDILTPQQQAKLEDRIITEVANYWYSWRLAEAKKETQLLPEINRLLAKLTGSTTEEIPVLAEGTEKDLLNAGRLLAFLDASIAKLEANALVPVQHRSEEVIQIARTQLYIFLYGKEQLAARGEITVAADDLETQKLNFQALLEAAINYFFGAGTATKIEASDSDRQSQSKSLPYRLRKALPKSRHMQEQDLDTDPWLSLSDLFGNTETIANKPATQSKSTKSALSPSSSAGISIRKNLTVQQPKPGSGLVQRKTPTRNLTPTKKTPRNVASTKQTKVSISQTESKSHKGEISQRFRQNTEVEAKPDWIETSATSMGYEKHPLEQLLEWLDRAIVWLEEIFVKLFQSWQSLWQGK
jgi:hypothetical protein